jgi:hypothetical protein
MRSLEMTIYIVQEFVAGQWFPVRNFETLVAAEYFAGRFLKARVIIGKK